MAAIIELPGDKRRFLAGMRWSTHESLPSRKMMLDIAAKEGWWVARRRGRSIIQSGYCPPLDGFRNPKGLLSIAAMIAEAKPEPWLGIFDLGDGLYWYVAVRDNNGILPDGDVIGTYDEVSAARAGTAGLGQWTYVDGGLDELSSLMRNASSPVPVRDIRSRPWMAPMAGGAIIAAMAASGLWAWHAHEAREAHDRAMAMARERAMIAAMQAKKTRQVILPWTREPSPSVFLAACGQMLGALPVSRYGWMLSAVDCHAAGDRAIAQAHWRIGPGATAARIPAGVLSRNGKQVDGSPMTAPMVGDRDGHADDAQAALRALYAVAQPLGVSVSVTGKKNGPVVAALPGRKVVPIENPGQKPWQTMEIFMKTSLPALSLDGLGARLDAIPGFRLTDVSAKGGQWEIAGTLYVSRMPMPSAPLQGAVLAGGRDLAAGGKADAVPAGYATNDHSLPGGTH